MYACIYFFAKVYIDTTSSTSLETQLALHKSTLRTELNLISKVLEASKTHIGTYVVVRTYLHTYVSFLTICLSVFTHTKRASSPSLAMLALAIHVHSYGSSVYCLSNSPSIVYHFPFSPFSPRLSLYEVDFSLSFYLTACVSPS